MCLVELFLKWIHDRESKRITARRNVFFLIIEFMGRGFRHAFGEGIAALKHDAEVVGKTDGDLGLEYRIERRGISGSAFPAGVGFSIWRAAHEEESEIGCQIIIHEGRTQLEAVHGVVRN